MLLRALCLSAGRLSAGSAGIQGPGVTLTLFRHLLPSFICWVGAGALVHTLRKWNTCLRVPTQGSCCSHPQPWPYPPADASALVAALTRFSHLAADTIVNGGATSHLAPTDPADRK